MECLGRYTFVVMTSVILSGGVKMRVEHGMTRGYTFVVMTSVILSGCVKMRAEHGMLREVYIFCHDSFCSLPGSTFACFSASREDGPRSQKSQEMPKPGARPHKRITTCQENAKTTTPPTEAIQTTAGHEAPG